MSKIFLALSLAIMLAFTACTTVKPDGGDNAASGETAVPVITDMPDENVSEKLTADEAFLIYNIWLDDHFGGKSEIYSYTVNNLSNESYEYNGEDYYLFRADDDTMYWYNILAHKQTGELFMMMTSDGEEPVTEIEPLDDWYERFYGGAAEGLAADEAAAVYSDWLDMRDFGGDNKYLYALDGQSYEAGEYNGDRYYLFPAADDSMYWYNILVHMETGELLVMITPDGEVPVTEIEPLDNWYERHYGE